MRKILRLTAVILLGAWAVLLLPCWKPRISPRALEAVLRNNLGTLRSVIAQYHGDKGRYPESLDALIAEGYLRKVPIDPFTKSNETWRLTFEGHLGAKGPRGIVDAHSGARGKTLNGQPLAGL